MMSWMRLRMLSLNVAWDGGDSVMAATTPPRYRYRLGPVWSQVLTERASGEGGRVDRIRSTAQP
jgi:hypothetical protein